MVYQLIYTSSATEALNDAAMRELAMSANYRNAEIGITGMLLFNEGSILQVLEGEETAVKMLFEFIKNDTRHTGAMVLIERSSEKREFSKWFMGYRNVTDAGNGEALFKLTQESLRDILPPVPTPELAALTRTYARVSGL